jgi:hypothetical protein
MFEREFLIFAGIFYLLGVLTPVIVLRALTRDREDGCILNLAILVIVGLIIALGLSFLISS